MFDLPESPPIEFGEPDQDGWFDSRVSMLMVTYFQPQCGILPGKNLAVGDAWDSRSSRSMIPSANGVSLVYRGRRTAGLERIDGSWEDPGNNHTAYYHFDTQLGLFVEQFTERVTKSVENSQQARTQQIRERSQVVIVHLERGGQRINLPQIKLGSF